MRGSLDAIAKHLTDGAQDATTFEWHRLRYNHIVKIRSWVAKHYKWPICG